MNLSSSSSKCSNFLAIHRHAGKFSVRKLRRFKQFRRSLGLCSQQNFSFDSVFQNLPSLDFLAPAVGLTSGLALQYLSSQSKFINKRGACDIGEWILFTSPTPFNRFVILRCPSIAFEGDELNDRLVKEERHFVSLNSGRMIRDGGLGGEKRDKRSGDFEYQRVCVNTEDGGVISMDWPENLDLKAERGLDTTVLLVPGTVEGSGDPNIKAFAREALRRGFFPVVMNPRGCAGSPLTTPRLFTAADSDDISTAIQYINKARPWTTMMGVGWGYGANMLTKYLAEVGERTPLTAATCIDNPFDLEEATRAIPYRIALDEKLARGLVDILRSNKVLFQGRAKGFDVEKALLAKSVRDFETAISMVSYGFETVEDFYSKSSTEGMVGSIKIPILFIQNDDQTVPLFSIPRSSIAENPFTTLLICSCSPSRAAATWRQHLTFEWLAAVELGLLKGRHPLLNDIDVTISPSKGLALVDRVSTEKQLNILQSNAINGYSLDSSREILENGDTTAGVHPRQRQHPPRNVNLGDRELQGVTDDPLEKGNSAEAELGKDDVTPEDGERGQVIQTAQVVMNMVDATLPGILKEEEKKKVLDAVNRGETVMKALQDAVPEDVREKLTIAASGIMHAQGINLAHGIGSIPYVSSGLGSKPHEQASDAHQKPDETKRVDDFDGSNKSQVSMDETAAGLGSEILQKPGDEDSQQGVISSSVKNETNGPGSEHENNKLSNERSSAHADSGEIGQETSSKPNSTSRVEKEVTASESIGLENKVAEAGGVAQVEIKENNSQKKEEKVMDSPSDQNKKSIGTAEVPISAAASPSQTQPVEGEDDDNQKKETKSSQPVFDQIKSITPDSDSASFSVSQALDALTGMDDSTQVAVNSVFGVIENMISQLEEEKEANMENEVKEESADSAPETQHPLEKKEQSKHDHTLEDKEGSKVVLSDRPDGSIDPSVPKNPENQRDLQHGTRSEWIDGKVDENSVTGNAGNDASINDAGNNLEMELKNSNWLVGSRHLTDDAEVHANNVPSHINAKMYGEFPHNEFIGRYLLLEGDTEPLDLDTTTALLLDYIPEDDQWKLSEQLGSVQDFVGDITPHKSNKELQAPSVANIDETDEFIEPSYVILDTERLQEPVGDYESVENAEVDDDSSEELIEFVEDIILDCLKVEVHRRLSTSDLKDMETQLATDIEKVATAVSSSVVNDSNTSFRGKEYHIDYTSEKISTVLGENIIRSISSAVQGTGYLRRVLPLGVIVGSSLAALRKYFHVSAGDNGKKRDTEAVKSETCKDNDDGETSNNRTDQSPGQTTAHSTSSHPVTKEGIGTGLKGLNNNGVMVGAVTAALGASAFLAQKQDSLPVKENPGCSAKSFKEKGSQHKELVEEVAENNHNSVMTSLAEKAMSVAGPVVPTKEDGEVDQERLVAMLVDLGQKGGLLRLAGKFALLWGGIRGAMSLTDKLILFLHIAERPLFLRIIGFVGMVLVLWSPVVIPLLPTLVQSWTTNNPSSIGQLACIIGFYVAVMILVILWGKRIRGYVDPVKQYGLDLISPSKIQDLVKGLIGGIMLVTVIQSINSLLGYASFSWPLSLPSSSLDAMTQLKVYGKLLMLAVRGLVTASGVVVVEEVFFRSWLPEEITVDLGHHQGIILSGLAFSLSQRSLWAMPGMWLLSLALAGIRQQNKGNLSIPIGLRVGIISSSFVLQSGGFLIYKSNFPVWLTGTHPFQPFSGVVGFAFASLLAILLYPRQSPRRKKLRRRMRK